MRCDNRVCLLLAASLIVAHLFCNVAAAELLNRQKRQDRRDFGGFRDPGPQHRPREGPRGGPGGGNSDRVVAGNDGFRRQQNPQGFAQPLSGSQSDSSTGTSYSLNSNLMETRTLRATQSSLLGLGSLNSAVGGLGGQEASANQNQGGIGLLGIGGSSGQGMGLLNLGGSQQNPALINIGGQQTSSNGPQGPNYQGGGVPGLGQPGRPGYDTGFQGAGGPGGFGGPGGPPPNRPGGPPPNRPGGPPPNRPGRPGERPGGFQNGRPDEGTNWNGNRRPGGEEDAFVSRPGQGQVNSGGSSLTDTYGQDSGGLDSNTQQFNGQESGNSYQKNGENQGNQGNQGNHGNQGNQGNHGNPGNQGNHGNPGNHGNHGNQGNQGNHGNQGNRGSQGNQGNQGNQGGNGKKCRGNQFTCQNRDCVSRNARCNGVEDCEDGSDELNCSTSSTTTRPYGGQTTASPRSGCVLPQQPTGGSFEVGGCEAPPCNNDPGTRLPVGGYLTYTCDEGYTLKGNNVSFCHNGSWYLPPICRKTCPALKSNSVDIECKYHGEIVSCETAIAPGTKATLACKHSFSIPLAADPAYREVNCLPEGIWDRTLFRCLPDCGTAVSHGNTLIVNGFTAKLGVFPWHVGIYRKNPDRKYQQICAGSLISPDLVISAAHCFYDDTVNEVSDARHYAVAAGKHYRAWVMPEKYAQTSTVKSIEVASRYFGASGNFAEDISIVRLENPFTLTTLVRPVCMDWDNIHERQQLESGQSGKAVGWGKTAAGQPSSELQEINLPYIPYQECVSAVPEEFKGYVTADKFCAGYLNGSSLCEGDSGGGLCFQLNGLWYLRGVVSVSPVSENTCDNNYYTAFTNVGRFREWVRAAYVSDSS